jgi:hypothetical protein
LTDLIKEHIDHIEGGTEDQVKEALKFFQNTKASIKLKGEEN